ncbi:hypothetical protein [Marinicella litoralis]|nr:hypothetical protein [Marinicella litoralis]
MKITTLTLITFILLSFNSNSQTVNDVPMADIDSNYIQVSAYNKFMSNKLKVHLDFGQFNSIWKSKDTQLRGRDGKMIQFNSVAQLLNYMTENGYELISFNTYAIDNALGHTVYSNMLLKKIKK